MGSFCLRSQNSWFCCEWPLLQAVRNKPGLRDLWIGFTCILFIHVSAFCACCYKSCTGMLWEDQQTLPSLQNTPIHFLLLTVMAGQRGVQPIPDTQLSCHMASQTAGHKANTERQTTIYNCWQSPVKLLHVCTTLGRTWRKDERWKPTQKSDHHYDSALKTWTGRKGGCSMTACYL